MELNYIRCFRIVVIISTLIVFSCGTNYYYNEEGGLRPKENNFDETKLGFVNYQMVDTNAIYISSKKRFYKFYSNKKVGFGMFQENTSIEEALNPKRLKMGYFEMKDNNVVTYIFINKGSKVFIKNVITFQDDLLVKDEENFKKKKIDKSHLNNFPDW